MLTGCATSKRVHETLQTTSVTTEQTDLRAESRQTTDKLTAQLPFRLHLPPPSHPAFRMCCCCCFFFFFFFIIIIILLTIRTTIEIWETVTSGNS